ncbi:MAG: TonB-dependent receptor plug domain-containing protein [Chloroflexia bacterium]|nr:TonB-dependent receptor plug domain-containing protein [Chloroflexia bacterium]
MMQKCINSGFDEKQKVQAYRLIAKTQLELDNDSLAQNAIVSLLQIEPQFQPDYLTDPTRFIEVLQEIKEQNNEQLVTSVSKKAENIKEAPATVVLLTSKELKNRGYLDLEAVMHDLPGFDISRSNGNLYSHIYQRGYRSINTNRTLFLVDGVEENDLWSSNVYLSRQYPLSNIKNVEIVYGPASTMYGSNAFLGVVNVITKEPWELIEPGKIFGVNARLTYGSYNTKMVDITLAARTKNNNISASLTGRVFLSDEQDLSGFPEHSYEPRELTDEFTTTYHNRLDITNDSLVGVFLASHPANGTFYGQNGSGDIILTDAGVNQALAYDNEVYNNAYIF